MPYIEGMDEQLFDRYEKRSKTFSQIFNATMIFALAFLTIILVPFVSLQQDEKAIEADLREVRKNKKINEDQLNTLEKEERRRHEELAKLSIDRKEFEEQLASLTKKRENVKEKISRVEEALERNKDEKIKLKQQIEEIDGLKSIVLDIPAPDVNQFVTEIRAFLQPAQEVVSGNKNIGQLGVGTDCPRPDKDQFFNCLVRAKVMRELSVPYTQGPRAIVPRMAAVDPNLADNLEAKINATIMEFDNILSTDPEWWQELTKKFHVGEQFKKVVEDLLKEINGLIESKSKKLGMLVDTNIEQERKLEAEGRKLDRELADLRQINNAVLTNIKGIADKIKNTMSEYEKIERGITAAKASFNTTNQALDTLNKRLEQITSEKVAVSNRIKNVESPFGTLPVGLNEAFQIFPMVVIIGALMYWIILSELINLRCNYHMTLKHKYSSDHTVVDSNVVLFAPLFIDPQRGLLSNLWRGCVLAIPIVIYVAAIVLILYSWSLDATVKGTSTVIRNVYMAVYLISFFLLFIPISRVVIEWRNYRNRFSSISE